tara:strand:+ start:3130 stop:4098 length:969 start_codon:yes stop_codon:yes gene_type:complete
MNNKIFLLIPTYKRPKKCLKLINKIYYIVNKFDHNKVNILISENGDDYLKDKIPNSKKIIYTNTKKYVSMAQNISNGLLHFSGGYLWIIPDDDKINDEDFIKSICHIQQSNKDILTFNYNLESDRTVIIQIKENFFYENISQFIPPFMLLSSLALKINSKLLISNVINKLNNSNNTYAQNYILMAIWHKNISINCTNLIPFSYNNNSEWKAERFTGSKGVVDNSKIINYVFDKIGKKTDEEELIKSVLTRNLITFFIGILKGKVSYEYGLHECINYEKIAEKSKLFTYILIIKVLFLLNILNQFKIFKSIIKLLLKFKKIIK